MKSNAPQRTRMRAHAVLLSHGRFSIDQIASIYEADRDRVSRWLEGWREFGFDGLADDERAGRPPKLSDQEQAEVIEIIKQEPRSCRRAVAEIAVRLKKKVSPDTVKRVLRRANYRWKRARRSLRTKRDEAQFRAVQTQLAAVRERAAGGDTGFELWYFDEAGFTLTPSVPYAWQAVGERIELDSFGNQRRRQNILGFLRWDGLDFYAAAFEGSLDNHLVGGVMREFAKAKKGDKPKLIVLDNAPAHRGDEIEEEFEELAAEGVFVWFLPSYSPELNVIELLWKKVKYEWLGLNIYENFQKLTEGLFEVLKEIGSKYRITFA